eukprot:CAMPEP_0185485730 /NCGR_PEP_ID=MMETSP1366-20130426/10286_1 /TAXON_ID=38817 /ORGANISM="Gephyrocapsa oceanica, Strain RCC1303" /LENGTH=572 /DNA_ID=CAMNT_0028093893 /DNA_START=147 /DNA_END=1863 /DNA_ORIENTATION=-
MAGSAPRRYRKPIGRSYTSESDAWSAAHAELPLHENPHTLLPYVRCPLGRPPAADAAGAIAGTSEDRRGVSVVHGQSRLLARSAAARAGDSATPQGDRERMLQGMTDAGAAAPPSLVDELVADERKAAAAEARWDAFAGNCVASCRAFGPPSDGGGALLLSASGEGLDSLALLGLDRLGGCRCLGGFSLPAGRQIRQVAVAPLGAGTGLGLARSHNWLHFVRVQPAGGGGGGGSSDAALSCAAVSTFGSRVLHAVLNPRLPGEAVALLETGHLSVLRLERLPPAAAALSASPAGGTAGWREPRLAARLPWQAELARWRAPPDASLRWGSAEFGEHPRTLLVAGRASLHCSDLRAGPAERATLLLDLEQARPAWRQLDGFCAMATPPPARGYGGSLGAGAGGLVALASPHSLLLYDVRCLRAPRQQWSLPPTAGGWPEPRGLLGFAADALSVEFVERGTGRAWAFPVTAAASRGGWEAEEEAEAEAAEEAAEEEEGGEVWLLVHGAAHAAAAASTLQAWWEGSRTRCGGARLRLTAWSYSSLLAGGGSSGSSGSGGSGGSDGGGSGGSGGSGG